MSLFDADLAKEAILGEFLSAQYNNVSLKMNRISDKDIQMAGVDLVLEKSDGLSYKIDEKAQLHYLNKDLLTFALEINYFKDGILKNGWLYDSKKATEIYAFVFSIHLKETIVELEKVGDIESCEVVFVNRIRLINELAKLDLNFKVCEEYSKELRLDTEVVKIEHDSGFKFQISNQLSEKPVNLIVKKIFLERIGKKYTFKKS